MVIDSPTVGPPEGPGIIIQLITIACHLIRHLSVCRPPRDPGIILRIQRVQSNRCLSNCLSAVKEHRNNYNNNIFAFTPHSMYLSVCQSVRLSFVSMDIVYIYKCMYIFYVGYLGSLSCPEIGFFSGLFQACGISPRVE